MPYARLLMSLLLKKLWGCRSEMAQAAKSILDKPEDMSSDPQHLHTEMT